MFDVLKSIMKETICFLILVNVVLFFIPRWFKNLLKSILVNTFKVVRFTTGVTIKYVKPVITSKVVAFVEENFVSKEKADQEKLDQPLEQNSENDIVHLNTYKKMKNRNSAIK